MKLTLSEQTLLQAHEAAPGEIEPLLKLGLLEGDRGRADQALEYFRRALALDPICVEAHVAAADVLLRHGRWQQGWTEHEWRLRLGGHRASRTRKPVWKGQPLDGATLLLQREQTLSEQLLFLRYVRFACDRAATVVLETSPELARLARRLHGVASVVASDADLAAAVKTARWRCAIGSLPFRLGSAASGASKPYLTSDPASASQWKDRIDRAGGGLRGRRIGVSWSAESPDRRRLCGSDLAPLSSARDVAFVGLPSAPGGKGAPAVLEMASHQHDLADAADLIAGLDVVITDDNPMADLAGAMGKPAWVLLPEVADWRWGTGATTPWYPSARLFRQAGGGGWADVVTRVVQAL